MFSAYPINHTEKITIPIFLYSVIKSSWFEQIIMIHNKYRPSDVIWWERTGINVNLTHWGRVTHICVSKLTIIGSYKGLSPGPRQAIIWTSGGILLIGGLGTNFSEILIEILTFSFKKIHLQMSSGKWWPFCLCLNVLTSVRSHDIHGCSTACGFVYNARITPNIT